MYKYNRTALWRKRLVASHSWVLECVSITPCQFRGGRNGVCVGFSGFLAFFPCHKFNFNISPHSSHSFLFHFISPILRQVQSVGLLAIHRPSVQELHHISSLDPARLGHELRLLFLLYGISSLKADGPHAIQGKRGKVKAPLTNQAINHLAVSATVTHSGQKRAEFTSL